MGLVAKPKSLYQKKNTMRPPLQNFFFLCPAGLSSVIWPRSLHGNSHWLLPVLCYYVSITKERNHAHTISTTVPTPKKPSQTQVLYSTSQVPLTCPHTIQVLCRCPCLLHQAQSRLQIQLGPNHSQSLCLTPYDPTYCTLVSATSVPPSPAVSVGKM